MPRSGAPIQHLITHHPNIVEHHCIARIEVRMRLEPTRNEAHIEGSRAPLITRQPC
jgi:hypothetical protein